MRTSKEHLERNNSEVLRSSEAIVFIEVQKDIDTSGETQAEIPPNSDFLNRLFFVRDDSVRETYGSSQTLVLEMVVNLTTVKFVIPKGHLTEESITLLRAAGYTIRGEDRTYKPTINDHHIELRILRPQEIPIFVEEGLQDIGITGQDWIEETKADVVELANLGFGTVRLVVAVPKEWDEINSLEDLLENRIATGKQLRVSTEYLNIAKNALLSNEVYQTSFPGLQPQIITPWWKCGNNEQVGVYLSFGATEAKTPLAADAIVEVVDTGTSLKRNGLKIIHEIMSSSAVLISNSSVLENPSSREKVYDILTLLRGVIEGRRKLHIFVNVQKRNLNELLDRLPALKCPTISELSDSEWVAVNTIIDRDEYLMMIPELRRLAQGLVVYEPRQVLPLEKDLIGGEYIE